MIDGLDFIGRGVLGCGEGGVGAAGGVGVRVRVVGCACMCFFVACFSTMMREDGQN